MKELSIEEKAKAYDEAIKRGLDYIRQTPATEMVTRQDIFEAIFPELKESEEERIRKALMQNLKERFGTKGNMGEGLDMPDVLAWLEKQGEQKPADKDEPKFKVGDWIMYCGKPYQITGLHNNYFTFSSCDGSYFFNNVKSTNEPVFHFWTIQDAKAGDVLSYNDGHGNDCIELIKSITDKKIEFWFCLTNGNRYEVFDGIIPYTNLVSREGATLATKEQRNLLFQKMKEAGYKWDSEKKELKKIEQKPSDWSEEDKMMLQYAIEHFERQKRNCIEGGGRKKSMQEFIDWLKSLRPQSQWKPSKEQMEALKDAIEFLGCTKKVREDLKSLYEQMKKLREE